LPVGVEATGALQGWFTGDEAFGQNPGLRDWLAAHEVPYVLATARASPDQLGLGGELRGLGDSRERDLSSDL
jgi:hypothetical protein